MPHYFITDFVIPNVQCRECLWAMWGWGYSEYISDRLTWFTLSASPRCCAPSPPISLLAIVSVVSVCDHQWAWECSGYDSQGLTRFTFSASPRCCVPTVPILFRESSSVVSVCEQRVGEEAASTSVSVSLGSSLAPHPNAALRHPRSRSLQFSVSWVSANIDEREDTATTTMCILLGLPFVLTRHRFCYTNTPLSWLSARNGAGKMRI